MFLKFEAVILLKEADYDRKNEYICSSYLGGGEAGWGARVMLFVRAENMDCIILH